jgi:hypothetical protein
MKDAVDTSMTFVSYLADEDSMEACVTVTCLSIVMDNHNKHRCIFVPEGVVGSATIDVEFSGKDERGTSLDSVEEKEGSVDIGEGSDVVVGSIVVGGGGAGVDVGSVGGGVDGGDVGGGGGGVDVGSVGGGVDGRDVGGGGGGVDVGSVGGGVDGRDLGGGGVEDVVGGVGCGEGVVVGGGGDGENDVVGANLAFTIVHQCAESSYLSALQTTLIGGYCWQAFSVSTHAQVILFQEPHSTSPMAFRRKFAKYL